MSLNVRQALEARAAVALLVDNDKANKYIFGGATRIKLALNLRKLNPIQEEFQKDNSALIKQFGKATLDAKGVATDNIEVSRDSAEFAAFDAAQKELLGADSEVVLSSVSEEALVGKEGDPRSNQIPVDTLAFLYEVGILVEGK